MTRAVNIVLAIWLTTVVATPTGGGTLSTTFDSAGAAGSELPRLRSLLISWRGQVVLEKYYHGARSTVPVNIKSASKTILSALVGIAIERGQIKNIKQPIAPYFSETLAAERDSRKRSITVEDLLTMRSGLQTTSNRNYGAWVLSSNWVRHVLNRPLIDSPGETMEYSTGNTHLLSAILTQATKTNTWRFAQDVLAKPMGFSLPPWPQDPQGIYFGGNDMLMTPRQMLLFGEMYLNRGRINNQQIVPARWVEASFIPRAQSRRETDRYYGYGWWIRELAGHQAFYAWGYGGQFIFVVPDVNLVVVTTSVSNPGTERRDHLQAIYRLVERHVIGAIDPSTN